MSVNNFIQNKFQKELADYGRGMLSVLYPNDIEMYLIAFELVDSKGKTDQYFIFPVMPNSIQKTEQNRTSIKRSSSGTAVLMSPSFSPPELNIRGDFGRSFKILTNPTGNDFTFGFFKKTNKDKLDTSAATLDPSVKSGYGCIKILQNMIQKSGKLDDNNKPYRLYFYNLALGESYLVVIPPNGLVLSQNYDRNMIWSYQLTMNAVANLDDIKSSNEIKSSSTSILNAKTIQNGVNLIAGETARLLL